MSGRQQGTYPRRPLPQVRKKSGCDACFVHRSRFPVLSREQLLETVWGYANAVEIESRTVDVHVRRLRAKLGPEAQRIVTVKAVGYRFDGDS